MCRSPASLSPQRAAMVAISTLNSVDARRASTVARAGRFDGSTHSSQARFISSNVAMSSSQIVTDSSFDLSLPAAARCPSIAARTSRVCS